MDKAFIFLFLIFSTNLSAKVLDYQAYPSRINFYTAKEMCLKLSPGNELISDFPDLKTLDCMGKIFELSQACEKMERIEGTSFLRGFFDVEKNKAGCQYGRNATLVVSCDKRDRERYCGHEKEGCGKLKDIFARGLDLAHAIMGENDSGELEVRCYYSVKKEIELTKKNAQEVLY